MTARVRAAVVAALLVSLVVGCQSEAESDDGQKISVDSSNEEILAYAEQVLLRKCMKDAGFEYVVEPRPIVPGMRDFPYFIDDVRWAESHGYGSDIQRALLAWQQDNPNGRYFRSLSTERKKLALVAVNGSEPEGLTATTPDGVTYTHSDRGCDSAAQRELYGDLQGWYQAKTAVAALNDMIVQQVKSDPAFVSAVSAWSTCMAAAGTPYPSPDLLRAQLPPPEDPMPFTEERKIALNEVNCANDSGLARATNSLKAEHRGRLYEKHAVDVVAKERLQEFALPRARVVISDSNLWVSIQ